MSIGSKLVSAYWTVASLVPGSQARAHARALRAGAKRAAKESALLPSKQAESDAIHIGANVDVGLFRALFRAEYKPGLRVEFRPLWLRDELLTGAALEQAMAKRGLEKPEFPDGFVDGVLAKPVGPQEFAKAGPVPKKWSDWAFIDQQFPLGSFALTAPAPQRTSWLERDYQAIASKTAVGTRADKVLTTIEAVAIGLIPAAINAESIVDSLCGTGSFTLGRVVTSLFLTAGTAAFVAVHRHSTAHSRGLMMGSRQNSAGREFHDAGTLQTLAGQRFTADVQPGQFAIPSGEKPQKPRWNSSLSLFTLTPFRSLVALLKSYLPGIGQSRPKSYLVKVSSPTDTARLASCMRLYDRAEIVAGVGKSRTLRVHYQAEFGAPATQDFDVTSLFIPKRYSAVELEADMGVYYLRFKV